MSDQAIGIIGAGGQADETESYMQPPHALFRAVTAEYVREGLIDIEQPTEEQKQVPVITALGAPKVRKAMLQKWPGNSYATVIAAQATIDPSAQIGEGTVVAPGAVITTNVKIGEHSSINIGATISHDCQLGAFTTVSPGVHIAGKVHLGDGVFVGIGATISNGLSIAPGVVIGAGAVVIKDITEENAIYAGVPAVKIGQNEGWLEQI